MLVEDRETTYDLYQGTFVRAWQHVSLDITPRFEPWLYHVATNLAIDYLRRARNLTIYSIYADHL